jgi:hypothetical protein
MRCSESSESVIEEPLKKRMIKKVIPGDIFRRNQVYDQRQEKRIGALLEEYDENEFVKKILEVKFDKFMDKKKTKKRLLKSWRLRNKILKYEEEKNDVQSLEKWGLMNTIKYT